jgi:mannose-6-phosphate isomerase
MNDIFKLKPLYIEKVWGYEKWNLSTHKNGCSTIIGNNKSLLDVLGKNLPILVKIIQANESLSIQVHPNDEYAKKNECDIGKTECWYILDAKENAKLVCGIKEGHNRESFKKVIDENRIEENIIRMDVKAGDMVYIPAGTLHAIEGGIKVLEIQQSSDITYRIYDWGRDRQLHIDKSLDVIDYKNKNKCRKIENFKKIKTPYFSVEKIDINGEYNDKVRGQLHTYTVISGSGFIESLNDKIELKVEETIYIKKNIKYKIQGNLQLIKSYI